MNWLTFLNRMSPAGISMFYGASDKDTAKKEVLNEEWKDSQITKGTFALKQDLQIIDLTHLPEIPSIFDKSNRKNYYKILFFRSFFWMICPRT